MHIIYASLSIFTRHCSTCVYNIYYNYVPLCPFSPGTTQCQQQQDQRQQQHMPCHHLGILNSFGRISQPRVSAGLMLPKFDYLSVLWVWLPVCALSLMTCLCFEFDDLSVLGVWWPTCLCLEFGDLSVLGVWWPSLSTSSRWSVMSEYRKWCVQ